MMTLISWVNRIYRSQALVSLPLDSSAKCLEILQSYLKKSGNFILPQLLEP